MCVCVCVCVLACVCTFLFDHSWLEIQIDLSMEHNPYHTKYSFSVSQSEIKSKVSCCFQGGGSTGGLTGYTWHCSQLLQCSTAYPNEFKGRKETISIDHPREVTRSGGAVSYFPCLDCC